ncbi:MAG TPA: hypothetical protein VGK69_07750 [Gaiellaceae bacterium]
MTTIELWTFHDPGFADRDVVGYSVEAADGSFGKIDEASYEAGAGYLVVDTSSLANLGFGKHALIPAAAIERVDHDGKTVHLTLTKGQIKDAPEYQGFDDAYRERVGGYYGPFLMAPGMVAPSMAPVDRR